MGEKIEETVDFYFLFINFFILFSTKILGKIQKKKPTRIYSNYIVTNQTTYENKLRQFIQQLMIQYSDWII